MNIKTCQNCPLHKNQTPSINNTIKSDILILGISSQKNTPGKIFKPLDSSTNSGKFIQALEKSLSKKFYKTNLIKCAPLNSEGKIRYPTNKEIESCLPHFEKELKTINPKIIIPLGRQVTNYLSKNFKISLQKYEPTKYKTLTIIPIDHPSYLMIYKRKELENYKQKIKELIRKTSSNQLKK